MTLNGRSKNKISQRSLELEKFEIELLAKDKIEENNIFIGSSLAYLFVVLFASLTHAVETYFGVILILSAIMIVWFFRDRRVDLRESYVNQIRKLSKV